MIGGAPIGATPIGAALTASSSGGNQSFTTAVSSTWNVPAPTVAGSGSATFTTAVSSTWTVPAPTMVQAGTITLPTALANWTVPAPTVTASGSASFTTAVHFDWTVPTPTFTGGVQGNPESGGGAWWWWQRSNQMAPMGFDKNVVIVPSDTINFDGTTASALTAAGPWGHGCNAIYVGGAGIVQVVQKDGTVVPFTAVAGSTLWVNAIRVNSTNTTATLMVAQFNY